MKLLLHTCCAPCSIQCVESLGAEGIVPELFWYNPNIHPFTEYRRRRDTLRSFAEEKKLTLITEDTYGLRFFITGISALEDGADENMQDSGEDEGAKQRCIFCYRTRLEKTASAAAERGFHAFSSTLLISPYQDHELIKQIGEELAEYYGIQFIYRDFRPLFRKGQKEARAADFYMQKYCGCIFSEEERYLGTDS